MNDKMNYVTQEYETLYADYKLACRYASETTGARQQAYLKIRKLLKETLIEYDRHVNRYIDKNTSVTINSMLL
jgi:hypothetical protein